MVLQDYIDRLEWVGYFYNEGQDKDLLEYLILKVTNQVKSDCNISTIPEGLNCYVIDRVAGEFLLNKKDSGLLEIDNISFDGAAKSIQLGDSKVEYDTDGSKTPEERFDALINYLVTNKKDLLVSFRQLRW